MQSWLLDYQVHTHFEIDELLRFVPGGEIAMANRLFRLNSLVLSCVLVMLGGGGSPYPPNAAAQSSTVDVSGTWSGTFFPIHTNVPAFSLTVVITPNGQAHFTGNSTLNHQCLKAAKLEVTVTGTEVVLAGSDPEGDNLTVRGTLDPTGTMLQSTYILNGSASGQCETDDGSGTLAKH